MADPRSLVVKISRRGVLMKIGGGNQPMTIIDYRCSERSNSLSDILQVVDKPFNSRPIL